MGAACWEGKPEQTPVGHSYVHSRGDRGCTVAACKVGIGYTNFQLWPWELNLNFIFLCVSCSRPSFFGGPVSTRELCVAPSWKELPSKKAVPEQTKSRSKAGPRKTGAGANKHAAPEPPSENKPRKRARDFSNLNADPTKQPTVPRTTAQPAAPKVLPRSSKPTHSKGVIRGKKGAAGRATAVAPTEVGSCKRQKADETLKARVAAMVEKNGKSGKRGEASPEATLRHQRHVPGESAATMRRYQQMTALGMQTVQLVSVPTNGAQMKLANGAASGQKSSKIPLSNKHPAASHRSPPGGLNLHKLHAGGSARPAAGPPVKQRLKGTFYGTAQPPPGRRRVRTVDDDYGSDLDSFLTDGEGEDGDEITNDGSGGWRSALREALGGYDPKKYAEVDARPDRGMHASYVEIAAEEARAARIAREIDRQEALREAEEKAAKLKRKKEREARRKKQRAEGIVVSESEEEDESDEEEEDFVEKELSSSDEDDEEGMRAKQRRRKVAGLVASF